MAIHTYGLTHISLAVRDLNRAAEQVTAGLVLKFIHQIFTKNSSRFQDEFSNGIVFSGWDKDCAEEQSRSPFTGDAEKGRLMNITSSRLGLCALLLIGMGGSAPLQNSAAMSTDSSFQAFLPGFERGIDQFINGDTKLWKENVSRRGDVTIMGAWGAYEKGWTEVGQRYDWAAARFKNSGAKATFEYISQVVNNDLAYTTAIESSEAHIIDQEKPTRMVLRVTHIFRKEQGAWKLVHRHADPISTKTSPSSVVK